jgi:hypothetical protein
LKKKPFKHQIWFLNHIWCLNIEVSKNKDSHRDGEDRRLLGRPRVCETHADEGPEELEGPPVSPIGTKDLLSQSIKQRRAV